MLKYPILSGTFGTYSIIRFDPRGRARTYLGFVATNWILNFGCLDLRWWTIFFRLSDLVPTVYPGLNLSCGLLMSLVRKKGQSIQIGPNLLFFFCLARCYFQRECCIIDISSNNKPSLRSGIKQYVLLWKYSSKYWFGARPRRENNYSILMIFEVWRRAPKSVKNPGFTGFQPEIPQKWLKCEVKDQKLDRSEITTI